MHTFIDQLVDVINSHAIPEYKLCIVVPNRRAGLFLKQKLIPLNDKPRWLPAILTIEDFVFSTSELTEPDNVVLLALLYKAHCKVSQNPMSFDSYLNWGNEILRDFEEVDQYLADSQKLFEYVNNARQIDVWMPGETMTSFEENYLAFYQSLGDLYKTFTLDLLSKKYAYQGLATRVITGNKEDLLSKLRWEQIIFAGFNALTPAQLHIIKYLKQESKGNLLVDADTFYLDDPVMEAGMFLRKLNKDPDLQPLREINSNFIRPGRKIFTCGVPGITGQARIAGSLLSQIPPEKYSSTALVLADEALLLPVLNALPKEPGNFNVTMGFPLMHTPLFALADSFMKMYVNAMNGSIFYHGDVTTVLQSTQLNGLIKADVRNKVIVQIKKNNYSYISKIELLRLAGSDNLEAFDLIFNEYTDSKSLIKILLTLFEKLIEQLNEDSDSTTVETLFTLREKTTILLDCIETHGIVIDSAITLYNFFREIVRSSKVPFYGEPLKGIQIMGMLETRMLDFENVILLSVNEDILPSAKSNKSFIPFDIRVHHGLPTHHERQSVFAYHFYRLLQRCENTWLVYNENGDTLGGGEKSRYIRQLEWELPLKDIEIIPLSSDDIIKTTVRQPLSAVKDDIVMLALHEKAKQGFSFSALRQYINCELAFYYTYILKLKETEEVEEDISAQTMGTILHAVLEDLYTQFLEKAPEKNIITQAIDNAGALIKAKTLHKYPGLRIDSGHNLLFIKVAETWLIKFLKSELNLINAGKAPIIKGIEAEYSRPLKINISQDEQLEVKIYGKIDRIDLLNGALRVIDYKTGKVDSRDTRIDSLDDLFNPDKEAAKQMQLILYKYLASIDPTNTAYNIQPGIITFRSLNKGFLALEGTYSEDEFLTNLKTLLEEIFDKDRPFAQTGTKYCKYCNFKDICRNNN